MFSYYSSILKSLQVIQVRKDIWRSLVQALAQSWVSFGLRLVFLGPYRDTFRTFPRMDAMTVHTELSPWQELQFGDQMLWLLQTPQMSRTLEGFCGRPLESGWSALISQGATSDVGGVNHWPLSWVLSANDQGCGCAEMSAIRPFSSPWSSGQLACGWAFQLRATCTLAKHQVVEMIWFGT